MELIIEASSGSLRGYTLVNVTIKDINDNSPRFAQDSYYASVQEDVTIGTTVTQVLATDFDSGSNRQITYSIFKHDQDESFDIDAYGRIKTRLPLDYEVRTSYRLVIEAVDQGVSPNTGTCVIVISVVDVNDQSPNFQSTLPSANVSESKSSYISVS